jgi:hypothetical protein
MSAFGSLYRRRCNTLVSWDYLVDGAIIGLEILKEMEEKMVKIKNKLKVSHDR